MATPSEVTWAIQEAKKAISEGAPLSGVQQWFQAATGYASFDAAAAALGGATAAAAAIPARAIPQTTALATTVAPTVIQPGDTSIVQAGFPVGEIVSGIIGALSGLVAGGVGGAVLGGGVFLDKSLITDGGAETGVISGPGAGTALGGPGVAEPSNSIVKKRWETRVYSNTYGYTKINFYLLTNGIVLVYNNSSGAWTSYRPKKHIVISSNPRISQIAKLERVYTKVIKRLAKKSKALKLEKGFGGK